MRNRNRPGERWEEGKEGINQSQSERQATWDRVQACPLHWMGHWFFLVFDTLEAVTDLPSGEELWPHYVTVISLALSFKFRC